MRASFVLGTINPGTSAPSGTGFIPVVGFSSSGTPGWDQPFTITSANNIFNGTAPIQLVFDDFRNGTPGATMGPSVPVSGIGNWIVDTRSPEISPYIFGPANSNAAGTGPCVRALNNEVSGAGGVFARGMEMVLGGEYTQVYTFRNERWNGWNGRNNAGGGGGYYKMEWFLDDGTFGSTAFDMILPVFIEGSAELQPSNIVGTPTWSGGLVTVTVNTGGNCFGGASSPPVIGSTFTAQIGNSVGGNVPNPIPWVPAAYNGAFPGAVLTATGGSPGAFTATFTYPLATNPGPVTTKGTLLDYGGYGTGVPSLSINTDIGGNSSGGHGLPTFGALNGKGPSSWNGTAFANDTWDQTGWNSIETMYLADQANPSTANGIRAGALYNAVNKQAYNHIVTPAAPLMGTPSPPWGSFNNWRSMGLLQDIGQATIDRSDHIVFLGNATNPAAARFFLSDQPTLAASTTIMPCTDYTNVSAGSWTITLRQGRFGSSPNGAYLWYSDPSNNPTLIGQFTQPIVFDFFVSTTGSDANNGLTPGTAWAITSLTSVSHNANNVANWNATAGKKIGIMSGYYDVSGMMPVGTGGQEMSGALYFKAGSSATAITYIASCDAAGNYSARAATIDGKGATNLFAGHQQTTGTGEPAIIIHGSSATGTGFLTIDGLRLTGMSYKGLRIGGGSSADGATITNPVVVKNCEFFGAGFNRAGMILTFGTLTGGSGYTNGTYARVPITGGSGNNGFFGAVTVSGGAVTAISMVGGDGGAAFAAGNSVSCASASIGGSGSGFSVAVATVNATGDPTDNCSSLWTDHQTNAITVTNNWFHDSQGHTPGSGDHFNGLNAWGSSNALNSTGLVVTNNTCVRAGNLFGKEGGISGTTIQYNYVDISQLATAYGGAIQDWTGNSSGSPAGTLTTIISNNIIIISGSTSAGSWDSLGGVSTDSQNTLAWRTPTNIFNNTVVNVASGASPIVGELHCNSGENGVGKIQYYNNIYWNKGGGTGTLNGNGNFRANPQSLQVMDYNLVPASGVTYAISSNTAPGTTVSTQTSPSAFATAYATAGGISGVEAHTATGAPTFVLTGLYAAQYQLAGGSLGKGTGSTNGTTGGTATDMGAWGNGATQIGCSFAT